MASLHNVTGWTDGATFLLDGVGNALPKGVNGGLIALDLVLPAGTPLNLAFDSSATGDQFYLASIQASRVPDGGTTVVLFGLSLLGLGAARRGL